MKRVGEQFAPLQITRGGNVIMVQIENEYGSFGSDKNYLNAVRQMILDAGFDVTLFTSDGDANKLAEGTLPDVLDLETDGTRSVQGIKELIFETPNTAQK